MAPRPPRTRARSRSSPSRARTWSSSRMRDRRGSWAAGPGDCPSVGFMRSGFPLRLHYRLELWRSRSGWFDQYISEASWDAAARHDPLADDFVLIRTGGSVTRYGTPDDLERGLELPYRVNLKVKGSGNFYFLCRLDVTTLNDTDLEELTRWLKGDVSPAVSGGGNLGGALARGAQPLPVRIAVLPPLSLAARSETFNPREN